MAAMPTAFSSVNGQYICNMDIRFRGMIQIPHALPDTGKHIAHVGVRLPADIMDTACLRHRMHDLRRSFIQIHGGAVLCIQINLSGGEYIFTHISARSLQHHGTALSNQALGDWGDSAGLLSIQLQKSGNTIGIR